MLLKLVCIVFSRRKCETWSDDTFNRRVVGKVKEESDTVERAVLLKVLLEEACSLHVHTHSGEDNGEVVFVAVVHVFCGTLDKAGLAHNLGGDLGERREWYRTISIEWW